MNSYRVEWLEKDHSGSDDYCDEFALRDVYEGVSAEDALEKARKMNPRGFCFEVVETVK